MSMKLIQRRMKWFSFTCNRKVLYGCLIGLLISPCAFAETEYVRIYSCGLTGGEISFRPLADLYPSETDGGSQQWSASASDSWIQLARTSGDYDWPHMFNNYSRSGFCDITIGNNASGKGRSGTITFNAYDLMYGEKRPIKTVKIIQDGILNYKGSETSVQSVIEIMYRSNGVFMVDGVGVINSEKPGSYLWQPLCAGEHEICYIEGDEEWVTTLNITKLAFNSAAICNPPMSKDNNIQITPTTRDVPVGGTGGAVLVSGSSATWTAAVSDDWIKLNATSGNVGYPVAYTVDSNPNVEERVGYVYVSGHVHTVKQAGVGGAISPSNQEFECDGGYGTVEITAQNKIAWQARPNVDWLSVTPTSGTGDGMVTFQVAPWHEVSTRSGTLTIAGQTFTVFQYGRRMKLEQTTGTCNYEPHVFPITVNALAITKWGVTPNASWISVVDGGNGQGADLVSVAVGENPSYKARTGTVTIGTETFKIIQEGRTDLAFSISPTETTASVNGANGLISVNATPDLPWTATSQANWLTVMAKFQSGSGNGNVVYTASPNPTLFERTGTITVTPEPASGKNAKKQTVTQPAALATLSISGYEFVAAGENCAVDVTVANIVEWGVANLPSWITASKTSFVGPGTVTLSASANETVYPRSATIRIAEHDFKVTQKARGVEVEYDTILFGTDGGYESIEVHPDGNVGWTAVASDPTWIVLFDGESGTGNGEVLYIVAPYVGTGEARTGTITIGDKVVYVTQRAYDLTIDPYAKWVTGNAGAGEIGVSAGIGDVWTAIVTEPTWITLVSGYDAGTGSGTVRFVYTENDTGKTRTGKIVIAGEVYTLTQAARTMVPVSATVEGGGTVGGAGSYVLGTDVTLTAVPDDGWKFLYWSGAVSSMQNPITITADVAKSVTATFGALTPEFTSAASDETGVTLTWQNLAWAAQYKIYRAPTSENVGAVIATIPADGTHAYVDTTGEIGQTYWYWVEAVGADVTTESEQPATGAKKKPVVISNISYMNLRGATHTNPATYEEETAFAFAVPTTGVVGYTFDKWTPAGITADTTGDQVVTANWTANAYSIVFHANGGSGTMDNLAMTYDVESAITSNAFVRSGHAFKGWATEEDGAVVYADGATVSNLTAQAGGTVELYAVWELAGVGAPVFSPADGTVFKGSCTVTLTCPTAGASIYCRVGSKPKASGKYLYSGPFEITETSTVYAFAKLGDVESDCVTVTYTKGQTITFEEAVKAKGITAFTHGGDDAWDVEEGEGQGGVCVRSGAVDDEQVSWFEATVQGPGTIAFKWKASCEEDYPKHEWDHLEFRIDGKDNGRLDGVTDWVEVSKKLKGGIHTLTWLYVKDEGDWEGEDCGWVDCVTWTLDKVEEKPTVEGDPGATVTGDAESGYVVQPSAGKTAVEVTIPAGVDAEKVTVEVGTEVETVKPHGAKVKVVKGGSDITDYLDIPAADAGGAVDLTKATVKEEIVKEALDPAKGAEITLEPSNVKLQTSNTRPGLTYTFSEGATLEGMAQKSSKTGDGKPWTPNITVKGGTSGFYSIGVRK